MSLWKSTKPTLKEQQDSREAKWKYAYRERVEKWTDYKKKHSIQNVANDRKKREELLNLLGNKCVKCGFNDPRALQIDHIKGKGHVERRGLGPRQYYLKLYKNIKEGSKDYQLLCANCNWIKKYENKERYSKYV